MVSIMEWFQVASSNGAFNVQTTNENVDLTISDGTDDVSKSPSPNFGAVIDANSDDFQSNHSPEKLMAIPSATTSGSNSRSTVNDLTLKSISPAAPLPRLQAEPIPQPSTAGSRKRTPRVVSLVAWVLRYNTAFLRACKAGDLNTAEILLSKGANIEARNNGPTVLYTAFVPKYDTVMKWLLEHGAEPHNFLLHESVAIERVATAQLLLHHEVDVDYLWHGQTPLMYASSRGGTVKMVEMLLKEGASVDAMGHLGFTPLYTAVGRGHLSIVEELVAHGSKLDIS